MPTDKSGVDSTCDRIMRAQDIIERLRHTQAEVIVPLCRMYDDVYEESYHAGGIDRAIEFINELVESGHQR